MTSHIFDLYFKKTLFFLEGTSKENKRKQKKKKKKENKRVTHASHTTAFTESYND